MANLPKDDDKKILLKQIQRDSAERLYRLFIKKVNESKLKPVSSTAKPVLKALRVK